MYDRDLGKMGIVFIDGKVMNIHIVKTYTPTEFTSQTISKNSMKLQNGTRRGGQSANRIQRIGKGIRDGYLSEFSDKIWNTFYDKDKNIVKIDILIICGPGTLYDELSKDTTIQKYFGNVMETLAVKDLEIDKLNERFSHVLLDAKSEIMTEVSDIIKTDSDKLVFGKTEVKKYLDMCMLEKVIVNEKSILDKITYEPEIHVLEESKMLHDYGNYIGIKYY
jgi:peptide subunit release factor 1 (eRF1)